MARSILTLEDVQRPELEHLLDLTAELKPRIRAREVIGSLDNRVVGLLFEKPSTRTRTSFEVAAVRLGAQATYMATENMQLERGEPIRDTARILGSMLDALVWRGYAQETAESFAHWAGIPVVNGLSDYSHPTQVVCDFFTIREAKGRLEGLTLAYVGAGDNVCRSLLFGSAIMGLDMRVASPADYQPDEATLAKAADLALRNGNEVELSVTTDLKQAAEGADVLYTDVWVSMGQDAERERRLAAFQGYQINADLISLAAPDVSVMHCLPAHRGLEIADDAMEGEHSIVWAQGENKLHGAAAILEWLLV